jgi:guanine nucleotide-binding protein G(i) subunit alpha
MDKKTCTILNDGYDCSGCTDIVGGNDYDQASAFLLNKFLELNKNPQSKQIYAHFTCATDTAQIKFVMAAVTDIIIQRNLRDTGLM